LYLVCVLQLKIKVKPEIGDENMNKPHRTETSQADMDRVIEEYMASTDEGLVNFAQSVRDGVPDPNNQLYLVIGEVSERVVEDISSLIGIDVGGYRHILKGSSVVHIEERHGPKGVHDHTMNDINDYGRITYVLDNYDSIERTREQTGELSYSEEFKDSNNNPAPLITYKKQVNGMVYVIEAVPDAKAKRLQIVSAYKTM
jgi:hypothetical protein